MFVKKFAVIYKLSISVADMFVTKVGLVIKGAKPKLIKVLINIQVDLWSFTFIQ